MSRLGLFWGGFVFFSSKNPRLRRVAAKELACGMSFTSLRDMPCTMNCCSLNCKMLPSCRGSV